MKIKLAFNSEVFMCQVDKGSITLVFVNLTQIRIAWCIRCFTTEAPWRGQFREVVHLGLQFQRFRVIDGRVKAWCQEQENKGLTLLQPGRPAPRTHPG